MYHEIKSILRNDTVFYSLVIMLVAGVSFGLGRLSVISSAQNEASFSSATPMVPIEHGSTEVVPVGSTSPAAALPSSVPNELSASAAAATDTTVIASKSGTKYHYPWCPGAKQIKETNRISFATPLEARASGYTPAANCPGLE
jgi:hypothetical protein